MQKENSKREGTITVNGETDIPVFLWAQLIVVKDKIHIVGTDIDLPLGSLLHYKKQEAGYFIGRVV